MTFSMLMFLILIVSLISIIYGIKNKLKQYVIIGVIALAFLIGIFVYFVYIV